MSRARRAICALLLAATPAVASAAAIEALREFVRTTRSGKTTFTQVVVNRAGKASSPASGSFQFQRPGKFRWSYEKPYEQSIVGDGERLWMHDRDLNQVTVRKLDGALGQSPAAILAGQDDLEKAFELKDDGARDGLQWLSAVPRARDTTFESVRIGLRVEGGVAVVAAMELKDTFGQTSILTFGRMERNPALPAETFRFVPPKGADILGGDAR
ncbi:MAG: outer membrane lipoprotein chaperone LolA [Burkholderiales bacterium]|nr:outer membrane lipoprotein chaperone LolA [Burkholderiales bacterium]